MAPYVDDSLLHGVCKSQAASVILLMLPPAIGFLPPKISVKLQPMQSAMPHLISLPYDRFSLLHLKAPNWKALLRLMASSGSTRIEPNHELAMSVAKTKTLYLRTVIQFIKATASEWQTVIWFTIDHPVPGGSKYMTSDVNMLPSSYSSTNLPELLRDAADSPVSKTYTVPATDSVPYPSLPISFPDLAMYLHAALEESRRVTDTSNGIRKLAGMVDTCYPEEVDNCAVKSK
ncbi:hypothetical protein C8J56DRAFT_779757 [Mycena floridula]|nr:hypothetical protein C8J56DRAFT_779757 [Mycena floridula]